MSYAIEVRKVAARIQGVRGEDFSAELFLHAARPHDPGVETIGDRLNNPDEQFLPCKTDSGVCLIRLEAIAYLAPLEGDSELTRARDAGAVEIEVEMDVATGDRLSGKLLCQLGEGHRLSDFLNTDQSRFLMFVDDSRLLFVSKRMIDRIVE